MSEHNPAADDMSVGHDEDPHIEQNLKSRSTWLRALFMCIYCLLFSLAIFVGTFVVGLGFLWVLFTGAANRQLQQAGHSMSSYIYQIGRYLTYNTDDRPFPFGEDWPGGSVDHTG